MQLDGEPVLHVHTARLGYPSYCWGVLLQKKKINHFQQTVTLNFGKIIKFAIYKTVSPKEASRQIGSPTHTEHLPYFWSRPSQLESRNEEIASLLLNTLCRHSPSLSCAATQSNSTEFILIHPSIKEGPLLAYAEPTEVIHMLLLGWSDVCTNFISGLRFCVLY